MWIILILFAPLILLFGCASGSKPEQRVRIMGPATLLYQLDADNKRWEHIPFSKETTSLAGCYFYVLDICSKCEHGDCKNFCSDVNYCPQNPPLAPEAAAVYVSDYKPYDYYDEDTARHNEILKQARRHNVNNLLQENLETSPEARRRDVRPSGSRYPIWQSWLSSQGISIHEEDMANRANRSRLTKLSPDGNNQMLIAEPMETFSSDYPSIPRLFPNIPLNPFWHPHLGRKEEIHIRFGNQEMNEVESVNTPSRPRQDKCVQYVFRQKCTWVSSGNSGAQWVQRNKQICFQEKECVETENVRINRLVRRDGYCGVAKNYPEFGLKLCLKDAGLKIEEESLPARSRSHIRNYISK